jgi:hypothetical protein
MDPALVAIRKRGTPLSWGKLRRLSVKVYAQARF